MGLLVLVLILLFGLGAAHAGSYTVTTTPEQEEVLAQIAARASDKPAPQKLMQQLVDGVLSSRVAENKRSANRQAVCAKVTDAEAKKHLGCTTK